MNSRGVSSTAVDGTEGAALAVADGADELTHLAAAFEHFTQKAARLQGAYDKLKRHLRTMNGELAEKNTELRRKVEELDSTRTHLNNVLESMGSGVIAVDPLGRVSIFNAAAEHITGYRRDEVLGRAYSDAFPERDDGPPAILLSLKTRRPHVIKERTLYLKDGRALPVGVSSSPLRDGNGCPAGALEIFHDLSEVKVLEERVRRADRLAALGQMAATVAHEIRNPLGGIEGFAALLERDLADRPDKREMARQILQGARSLNAIVTCLLDFTRPVSLTLRRASLGAVADSALGVVEQEMAAQAARVSVVRDFAAHDVAAVDPEQMVRVVLNLVRNAWQAMPEGGEIAVATERTEEAVTLSVRDTGCGMTEAVREKLFSPFFTTKETGTGLGLSIVRKIVLAHGGSIEVNSAPGTGTTVTVTVPRRPSGPERDTARGHNHGHAKRPRR
jgi:PAS domain S-box-containing protein